ncbi:hypothetical protein NKW53_14805 [Acetobacter orientalis]|nr:hypothetical protein [Acetobacter orientalis]MCP1217306.1 hypothetical protein [Acetobacter orientalis]
MTELRQVGWFADVQDGVVTLGRPKIA